MESGTDLSRTFYHGAGNSNSLGQEWALASQSEPLNVTQPAGGWLLQARLIRPSLLICHRDMETLNSWSWVLELRGQCSAGMYSLFFFFFFKPLGLLFTGAKKTTGQRKDK